MVNIITRRAETKVYVYYRQKVSSLIVNRLIPIQELKLKRTCKAPLPNLAFQIAAKLPWECHKPAFMLP
jgi:hypothetical protein